MVPFLWIGFYFAWQGGQNVMTMRYYLLLYGLLCIFAGFQSSLVSSLQCFLIFFAFIQQTLRTVFLRLPGLRVTTSAAAATTNHGARSSTLT